MAADDARLRLVKAELRRVDGVGPRKRSPLAKHLKMAQSPARFLRGAAQLFYADLAAGDPTIPESLLAPPLTRIQGDCHFANFGFFTEEGSHGEDVIWAPNDFDDAAVGHAAFDLLRFAVSVHLAADLCQGIAAGRYADEDVAPGEGQSAPTAKDANRAVAAFLAQYRETCVALASDPNELDRALNAFPKKHVLAAPLAKAKRRAAGGDRFLEKSTLAKSVVLEDGVLRFVERPDRFSRPPPGAASRLARVFRPYVDDEILDLVERLDAGTGSVNVNRYYLLVGPAGPLGPAGSAARPHRGDQAAARSSDAPSLPGPEPGEPVGARAPHRGLPASDDAPPRSHPGRAGVATRPLAGALAPPTHGSASIPRTCWTRRNPGGHWPSMRGRAPRPWLAPMRAATGAGRASRPRWRPPSTRRPPSSSRPSLRTMRHAPSVTTHCCGVRSDSAIERGEGRRSPSSCPAACPDACPRPAAGTGRPDAAPLSARAHHAVAGDPGVVPGPAGAVPRWRSGANRRAGARATRSARAAGRSAAALPADRYRARPAAARGHLDRLPGSSCASRTNPTTPGATTGNGRPTSRIRTGTPRASCCRAGFARCSTVPAASRITTAWTDWSSPTGCWRVSRPLTRQG